MSISIGSAVTPPIKVGMVSLGCAKNLVDSEVMLGLLARAGLRADPAIRRRRMSWWSIHAPLLVLRKKSRSRPF